MGGQIELNDTLQITEAQGFPHKILSVEQHQKKSLSFDDFKDEVFAFHGKPGARVFQPPPTRNFLVQNLDGKWIHWGKIHLIEQTISWNGSTHTTSGKFKIIELFDPDFQKQLTRNDSPKGLSYFHPN